MFKTRSSIIFLLLFAVLLVNWVFLLVDYDGYIHMLSLLSSSGKLADSTKMIIKMQLLTIVLFMLIYCIVAKPFKEIFSQISKQGKYGYLIVAGLLFAYYLTPEPWFAEDGFLESITVVFAFIASVLLLLSIYKKEGILGKVFKIVLAILLFIVAMEEISWGQNIFGWETPEVIAKTNLQNETNFHNFFNPYFDTFYIAFNLFLGIVLCAPMDMKLKLLSFLNLERYSYLLPSRDFDLFGFIFLLLSLYSFKHMDGELTEIIFTFFALMYTWYQYKLVKNQR